MRKSGQFEGENVMVSFHNTALKIQRTPSILASRKFLPHAFSSFASSLDYQNTA